MKISERILVYGLNSAGKSTLMKSIGLSVIMAQAGMYVPAKSFIYRPYKAIFARITGNDNLFKGYSSFVLEMNELRSILKRAEPGTLVIGDEVCRGTEHISGNSIVAATIIKLAKSGCHFIFATHLHEIAEMNRITNLLNVKPYHLTVEQSGDELIFDRKLKSGSGEKIYGITVARSVIQDNEFIRLAQEIKNELLMRPNELLPDVTSHYNRDLYTDTCQSCGVFLVNINDKRVYLDTHHINHQKDCVDGFVSDMPHMRMNSKYNLVVLCKKCHLLVHQGQINISKYLDTSNGRKLDISHEHS